MKSDRYDIIVLGSGFGGSLLATILCRAGLSVALIDRGHHPRFQIGESSTPAADFLLRHIIEQHRLDELKPLTAFGTWQETYPELLCGCKRGFSYFWHGADEGFQATTAHSHELLVTANATHLTADTQWYRPQFDQFLAGYAAQQGVTRFDDTAVAVIEHPRDHEWRIRLSLSGVEMTLEAAFVVDATGPAGVLLNWLKTTDATAQLQTKSSAVYSHFDGVRPLANWLDACGVNTGDHPYPAADSAVHHLFRDGWMWQLRFESGLTSLGYVFNEHRSPRTDRDVTADYWDRIVQDHPALQAVLGSLSLSPFPGQTYVTGRLQRLRIPIAGTDWTALPSTIGLIDPLHSTGIAQTLSGVLRISDILLARPLEKRGEFLQDYADQVVRELRHIDLLVAGCYLGLCDFRLFTAWSMVYFAAATTFEKRWNHDDIRPSFLCADDAKFVALVERFYAELSVICLQDAVTRERLIGKWVSHLRLALQPYNRVGLFEPDIPNMYCHTAAK